MSKAKENSQIASKLLSDVGSIVTADSDSLELLSPGTDGQVLTADSTVPNGIKWAAAGASGFTPTQVTDLTDSGDTTLHYHTTDRNLTNATGTLAVANGGTASTTAQSAINLLTNVAATAEGNVLTKVGTDATWATPSGAGIGDVSGPASSVSSNVVAFDGTTGKLIKDGGVLTTDIATKTGTETITNKIMSSGSTWNGNAVGALYGGTAQTSWTKGDILYSSATNTLAKLPVGAVGQVLGVGSAGIPTWITSVGGTTELGGYDPVSNYTWWVIGYKNAGAYMGYNGVTAAPDGQGQWLRLIPTVNEAPIEFNLYNSGSQGIASSNGAGTLTRLDTSNSTPFTSAWVGKRIQYGAGVYTVSTVTSDDSMTVTPVAPVNAADSFHVAYHRAFGFCNTVWDGTKTVITRVSGDPFIPTFDASFKCWINGTLRTVSFVDTQTYTCAVNLGTLTGVAFEAQITINDQLTTLRVQKMTGSNEENLSIFARYDGYHIRSYLAGLGKERPIYIGHTNTATKFNTDGSVQIGNDPTNDTSNWFNASNPGFWSTTGTALTINKTTATNNPPVWVQNTATWSNTAVDHYVSAAMFETLKTSGASCPSSLSGSIKVSGGTGDAIGVHGQVVADVTNGGAMTGVWARATGPTSTPTTGMICGLEVNVDNRHGATSYKPRKDNGALVGALIYNFSGAGKANHFGFVIEGTTSDSYHVGGLIEDWSTAALKLTATRSNSFGILIDAEVNDYTDKGIAFGARCVTSGISLGDNKINWGNSSQAASNEGDMLYNANSNILYFNQGGSVKEILACSGVGTSGSYTAERKAAVNIGGVTYYMLLSTTA